VQFQQFGVAVQFVPYVLSDNLIRLNVQPEVSQINAQDGTTANGATIPGLDTRRAKTTVELAPGESFMIAGLLQDNLNSNINQVPGASEIPILGSLLRNTSYQRNETELVIAVTPYLVDPLKSSDVHMPTDDFRPASVMEQFFYGTLGSMSGNSYRLSQTPSVEGPLGFMTD
jgi:pilus assembly protein CpaC